MFELFFARFFARSVDRIVAGLDKMEARLQAFAQRQLDEALADDGRAAVQQSAVYALQDEADRKRREAERALRVAERVHRITQ